MKENKKFFDNNCLNKGYKKIKHRDHSMREEAVNHMLPPLEIMEEYEAKYPGTFKTLIQMAQKEQQHRHKMHYLEMEREASYKRFGQISAIICLSVISASILALISTGAIKTAILIIVLTFMFMKSTKNFFRVKDKQNKSYSRRKSRKD
ncbi:MAG TPA: DUF2335 domain-containing protein [Candidatus Megaira endosymbiont of Nemacystus decipiens]|nr:DUF2335 domain-containing protein [Candidatus Megaera endosymbiont of Nemacystus decipiens]